MNIQHIPNIIKVGEIDIHNKAYSGDRHVLYTHKLAIKYDTNFPKSLKTKNVSLVYIFCVNDNIVKIGQSSNSKGIAGLLGPYLTAGQDDPGINRFAINWMIRNELAQGNTISVYMMYMNPIQVEVPSLFSSSTIEVPVSAKGMESQCLAEYYTIENEYPQWNYQESNTPLPSEIHTAFGDYKMKRVA